MISTIADLHFAPTAGAADNLIREGVPADRVHVTGNTVVDALHAVQRRAGEAERLASPVREVLERSVGKRLILVTCHRRENQARLDDIVDAVRRLAARPDTILAFALHPNPAVRTPILEALGAVPNIALLEPLVFTEFMTLMSCAYFVMTDSGGVQEEAPVLGVPLLVLRDHTERPEGVAAGTALLVGTDADRIVAQAERLLNQPLVHARMARKHSPFGDGEAGQRIADLVVASLDQPRPALALTQ